MAELLSHTVWLHHGAGSPLTCIAKCPPPPTESCSVETSPGSAESKQPSFREGGEQQLGTVVPITGLDGQRQRSRHCPLLSLGEAMGSSLSLNQDPPELPELQPGLWRSPIQGPLPGTSLGHRPKGLPGTAAAQVSQGFVPTSPDLEGACDKLQSPHAPRVAVKSPPLPTHRSSIQSPPL